MTAIARAAPITALTFDIGGTLVDAHEGRKRRLARALGRDPAAIDDLYRRHFLTRGPAEDALGGLLAELGEDGDDARLEAAVAGAPVGLFADVLPALTALSHLPLAVISNCSAADRELFEALEPAARFEARIYSCDIGRAKPDPEPFEAACRALGVDAGGIVHVGDDPLGDVVGPARLGWRTAYLSRDRRAPACPDATWTIAGLMDLVPIVAACSAPA